MKNRIFIQGFLLIAGTIAVILLHRWFFPQWLSEVGEEVTDLGGMLLVLNGFLLRVLARGYKAQTSRQSRALVTQGIYRLTRNPMYLGTFLIGVGAVMVTLEWWVFLVFLTVFLMIYLPQMGKEEGWLSDNFGEEYDQYCERVPRFFPNLSVLGKKEFWNEFEFQWKWFWSELRAMIVTVCLVIAIETWQDVRLFGIQELFEEILELSAVLAATVLIWGCVSFSLKNRRGARPA